MSDDKTSFGDRLAIYVCRKIATWPGMLIMCGSEGVWIWWRQLFEGAPLDSHNLFISLYTAFLDLLVLKMAITLRDLDRARMDLNMKLQRQVFKMEESILKEVRGVASQVDRLGQRVDDMVPHPLQKRSADGKFIKKT